MSGYEVIQPIEILGVGVQGEGHQHNKCMRKFKQTWEK